MTKELKNQLDAEMESALESCDTDRIRDAVAHSTKALCDCQMKTADRVKVIAANHPILVNDVKEIKQFIKDGKRKFVEIAFSAFKWILLGGAGTEFIRFYLTH